MLQGVSCLTQQVTGSSLSGNVLNVQASVSGNMKKVLGLCKYVYGTRPVSAHPWVQLSCSYC